MNFAGKYGLFDDFGSLIGAAHGMAVKSGWWPTKPADQTPEIDFFARRWDEQYNNFLSEISEAWEEFRAGRIETWFQESGKPEGFWIEIADLLIRMADTMGAAKMDLFPLPHAVGVSDYQGFIMRLYRDVARGWEGAVSMSFKQVFADCLFFAAEKEVDLLACIDMKMKYNATRSFRHGCKRA